MCMLHLTFIYVRTNKPKMQNQMCCGFILWKLPVNYKPNCVKKGQVRVKVRVSGNYITKHFWLLVWLRLWPSQ